MLIPLAHCGERCQGDWGTIAHRQQFNNPQDRASLLEESREAKARFPVRVPGRPPNPVEKKQKQKKSMSLRYFMVVHLTPGWVIFKTRRKGFHLPDHPGRRGSSVPAPLFPLGPTWKKKPARQWAFAGMKSES